MAFRGGDSALAPGLTSGCLSRGGRGEAESGGGRHCRLCSSTDQVKSVLTLQGDALSQAVSPRPSPLPEELCDSGQHP